MLQEIHNIEELNAVYAHAGPIYLMKHSSACGTSHYAFSEVETFVAAHPEVTVAYVVIQDNRNLSNAIADTLSIIHKSPQLFLLQKGAVAWSTSHMSITSQAMSKAVAKLSA